MRICQVLASAGEGGLEKHVAELAAGLARDHAVTVIGDRRQAAMFDPRCEFIGLDFSRGRRNPLLLLRLARALRAGRFDLIHAQANKAATLVGTLRPFLHPPLVATLHNQKRSVGMFKPFDGRIAVSRGVAERLAAGVGADVEAEVIYNGIAPPPPNPVTRSMLVDEFGLNCERPILLAVGRLVPAKGFDLLIEAVRELPVQLVILGEGPERERLEAKSGAGVRFAGQRDDVRRLLPAADGVVISSRVEGFSYVCAEALLAGVALLSTDVPVANEVLPAEWIVPREDAVALRATIQRAIAEPAAWHASLTPALRFAGEHFTLDAMVTRTTTLYRRLLRE